MLKLTFGTPERFVPTKFCANLSYHATNIHYDTSKIQFKTTARGCVLELPLEEDEQIFGFGLQLKGFNHKSTKKTLRTNSDPVANTGDSHAPVPFFVTNKGYGIFVDTLRDVSFYCGYGKNKHRTPVANNTIITTTEDLYNKCGLRESTTMVIDIPVSKGVDLYVFEGSTITEIVSEYNRFSGGGCDVPEWGLGVFYRCFAKYTGDQVMAQAKYFRDHNIPCDIIGLEPGWQSSSYSCSYVWDQERYPNYREVVDFLQKNGFHINLWEHAFINATSPIYKSMAEYSGDFEVWQGLVPDFSMEQAREIFVEHHRETIVSLGIDGFKLDECDNSDYVSDWSFPDCIDMPGGMDGEQYHNIFGTLYMQTILKALDGKPTLSQVRQAYALASSYPFVLYSDLYNHADFIRGVVNSGFSGILWTPEVRQGRSKKDLLRRIQTVVFSAQCLINAWYCDQAPWIPFDCEDEVRELFQIRESLKPMLKTAFSQYKETGKPPIRALVMDYTDDEETYSIDDEYIFCDRLIVAPLTAESDRRKVYLPKGNWVNYWTKELVNAGWFEVETDQIPVFEKNEP